LAVMSQRGVVEQPRSRCGLLAGDVTRQVKAALAG
jgi:hypothetical protein